MAHFLAGHDDDRSYPIARAPGRYRFGRTAARHHRGRAALNRVNGYLKNMIEAIANSKLRRMQRELELRGVRFDRSSDHWVPRDPARTGVDER